MRKLTEEEMLSIEAKAIAYSQKEIGIPIGGATARLLDYRAGYTECAGNSVPISVFADLLEAFKKAADNLDGSDFEDAQTAIKNAEKYLNAPT